MPPSTFFITSSCAMQGMKRVRVTHATSIWLLLTSPWSARRKRSAAPRSRRKKPYRKVSPVLAGRSSRLTSLAKPATSTSNRPVMRPIQITTLAAMKSGRISSRKLWVRATALESTLPGCGGRMGGSSM